MCSIRHLTCPRSIELSRESRLLVVPPSFISFSLFFLSLAEDTFFINAHADCMHLNKIISRIKHLVGEIFTFHALPTYIIQNNIKIKYKNIAKEWQYLKKFLLLKLSGGL